MPNIGWQELLLVLVVALVIFGPKRLPELGRSLGKGIREFKKATNEIQEHFDVDLENSKPPAQPASTAQASSAAPTAQPASAAPATAARGPENDQVIVGEVVSDEGSGSARSATV